MGTVNHFGLGKKECESKGKSCRYTKKRGKRREAREEHELRYQPDASVVPTPFRLVRVLTPLSRLGNFLKAFLVSVCTAFGVFIRTKLVS